MKAAIRVPRPGLIVAAATGLVFLAGCEQKATTYIISVPPDSSPIVEIEPDARNLLAQVARDQKFGPEWWVRLEVVWRKEAQINVTVEKHPPGPNDFFIEADGLHVVMPEDQRVYLRGARVSLLQGKSGWAFDVTFPYRTERERLMASEWLLRETEKRKAEPPVAKPKG